MADAELIRHQEIWKSFTTFVKLSTAAVIIIMIGLFAFVF
jgi:hypothetical protein